ncbi:glycoside hydrolase family 1 protein [bacterium]|nr:MAG: glycoside hydrolase family 1 protein [bacterium]
MSFPEGFLWGCSTAAYQVEGGNAGSNWTAWERKKRLEPCGPASNSWELWREDVRALQELHANAYRFSVEWSRVEPHPGEYDEAVLERYALQAKALRLAGIRPIVSLHHFSEPAWLYERWPQGWLTDAPVGPFLDFVERVSGALRGEVSDWVTFNEPMVWLLFGYGLGFWPPGFRRGLSLERTFVHNGLIARVARAHNEAYRLLKADNPDARVSLAQNMVDLEPARANVADLGALQAWDRFMHGHLLDLAKSAGTLDFIGVNYYTRIYVRSSPFFPMGVMPCYGELERALGHRLFHLLGGRRGGRALTDMGWEVVPEGLGRVLGRLHRAYGLPLLVTENGIADATGLKREDFLREHVSAMGDAMAQGADVFGYLHWSLVDNYEWGSFAPRFGLYSVDKDAAYKRRPANGSKLFTQIAKTNASCLATNK